MKCKVCNGSGFENFKFWCMFFLAILIFISGTALIFYIHFTFMDMMAGNYYCS